MKKVLPSFKFVLPTMLVVFATSGLSLLKTSSSSSAIWDELKQSFVKLDDNNRDYLVDNYDDLIERYSLIIANYHLENFLVDSQTHQSFILFH